MDGLGTLIRGSERTYAGWAQVPCLFTVSLAPKNEPGNCVVLGKQTQDVPKKQNSPYPKTEEGKLEGNRILSSCGSGVFLQGGDRP